CVVFTVTDGTNSVTATVSQSSILGHPNDQNPIVGYAADIDVSSLADGQITANAKVYPWIGTLASVHDSSANAAGSRSFCPQRYYKNVARFAAPPLAYVSPSGVDATVLASGATAGGIQKVSTDAATAAANPFATIASAMSALKAATTITGGACEGCEVRLMAGSNTPGTVTIQTYVTIGELVITRDPNTTKAAAILNLAATFTTRCPNIRMKGITIARTSTSQISVGQNSTLTFEDTELTGTSTAQLHAGGAAGNPATLRVIGHISAAGVYGNVAAQDVRLVRGLVGAGGTNIDPFCVIGSTVTNSGVAQSTAFGDVNEFIGFNRFVNNTGSSGIITPRADAAAPTIDGFALIQNVMEWAGVQPQPAFRMSPDNGTPSTHHVVVHHNTLIGSGGYGRNNILYVDTAASGARTHRLTSFKGNIHSQINTKHDVFAATSGNVGGWSYMYGVGCAGELTQFADSASGQNGTGGSFSQAYAGLGAKCGASTTVPLDPLFVSRAACFWNGSAVVAGAGNGDYRLQAGSPAAGMLTAPVLRFDLSGAARPASANAAGAYDL
ncbi:MAG: hypothetical protein JNK46_19725, partial [Methylobacteriaceae bacterium]|nr:hypothetical protein [Methylobacteriaceae bacterium]